MPRNVSSGFIAAASAPGTYPCLFVEIYFTSGPIRMCTSYQDKILLGNVYTGVGNFLEVSTIEDGSEIMARGINVSLSGMDPSLLASALSEFQVGLSATVWLAYLTSETNDLPANSVIAWKGRTDEPTISMSEKGATISVNLESVLLDMNTPVPYRYTAQTQGQFHPGDRGLDFVNAIQSLPIYWDQIESNNGTV